MKPFPTTFASTQQWLNAVETDTQTATSLEALAFKGYRMQLGLMRADVPSLQAMSVQDSIRAYCPKDCTKRFADEHTTEQWLKKGRLVFLLKEASSDDLAGIAWTGPGTSPHILDGKITGGIRVHEDHQGRSLAAPFLSATLSYTRACYSTDLVWFETWASNAGAVHTYQKIGFTAIGSDPTPRLLPNHTTAPDTRLYMILPIDS